MRAYVTATEYNTATGGAATHYQIQRASLAIDEALVGMLYDTDVNNLPTDADVLQAVKDATVAQLVALTTAESSQGSLKAASIGSASYTLDAPPSTGLVLPSGGGLCEDAIRILRQAGLLAATVALYG